MKMLPDACVFLIAIWKWLLPPGILSGTKKKSNLSFQANLRLVVLVSGFAGGSFMEGSAKILRT